MLYVRSEYGYVRDFDGEDYLWTPDKSKAWKMTTLEANLAYGRLFKIPKISIESV